MPVQGWRCRQRLVDLCLGENGKRTKAEQSGGRRCPPPRPVFPATPARGATAPALPCAQNRAHGALSSGATSLGELAGASVCQRAVRRGGAGVVARDFREYLPCGVCCHGFGRARGPRCGHDFIIAYSCRARAVGPSCHAGHMGETAAHRVDYLFPPLPVRPWVLSVPRPRRAALSALARAPAATPEQPAAAEAVHSEGLSRSPARTLGARLMTRIYETFLLSCRACGSRGRS